MSQPAANYLAPLSAAASPGHAELGHHRAEHRLVDAAIAVNEAASLDEALDVLVRTTRELLDADRVSVALWDEGLGRGVIRAVAGEGTESIGSEILPGASAAYQAAASGEPVVTRELPTQGLDPVVAALAEEMASLVSVPFVLDGSLCVTLHAMWRTPGEDEALAEWAELLTALGALTRIAFRTQHDRDAQRDRLRFEAVLDSVAGGMVVHTASGTVVNAAARRLLELDGDVARAEKAPPEETPDRPLSPAELLALLDLGGSDERRFRRRVSLPSGKEAVLEGTVAPIVESGGRIGSVTVFRDVTHAHNREVLTEQLLEGLFEALPVAIAIGAPDTLEILSVNGAFVRLVGYSEEEILGRRPPYPWLAAPDEATRIASLPVSEPVESLLRHRQGRLVPVDVKRFPIPGLDGKPAALVTLFSDLSEQRRFEQQLVQSGKLATIGELAAGVAHEINNPLFAILGLVEFLLKDVEPGTKSHDRLLLVQQTGLEIKEIVRALLDFAREPSEERALVPLRDAVHETLELVRRTSAAKGVEIVEAYDGEPTPVLGNPNQLKQIFLNLLTNASQAVGGEGLVEVAVRREGAWVVASVSDDGPGIPAGALSRIFEPFFTTRRDDGGSGLGLSVSHGIAAAHGGSLKAENRPGGGACFTLRLPVKEAL